MLGDFLVFFFGGGGVFGLRTLMHGTILPPNGVLSLYSSTQ